MENVCHNAMFATASCGLNWRIMFYLGGIGGPLLEDGTLLLKLLSALAGLQVSLA